MARFDFGLSFNEFGRMTPGMLMALLKRQNTQFKRECWVAGLVASTVFNSRMRMNKDDDHIVSPYDFVPGSGNNEERNQLKANIVALFSMMSSRDASDIELVRERTVRRLMDAGHSQHEVEEIFDEAFAGWQRERRKKDK